MSERIIMRTGEALVAGGPPGTAAEPEVIIGELDGPVGTAIASMTAGQVQVLAGLKRRSKSERIYGAE